MSIEAFLGRCNYPVNGHPKHPTWEAWTLDYELINKLVLKALFEDVPDFLSPLVPRWSQLGLRACMAEPEGMLYDLAVYPGPTAVYFEIKTWSRLYDYQIDRQLDGLKDRQRVNYILLGRTATEWSHDQIVKRTAGKSKKISYQELLTACGNVSGAASELAKAYANALLQQRERIRASWSIDPDK